MSRVPSVALAAAIALSSTAGATLATEARTTRIEPRPFYGATVTIEAGVRVFRPLPPHKNIIINPEHKTPLNLSIEDITERRTITGNYTYNYNDRIVDDGSAPLYTGWGYGPGWGYGRRGYRRSRGSGFRAHRRVPKSHRRAR